MLRFTWLYRLGLLATVLILPIGIKWP